MKVLSGEGIKDFALLGIFQIVRGHLKPPVTEALFFGSYPVEGSSRIRYNVR
jgi:hypothetical protein